MSATLRRAGAVAASVGAALLGAAPHVLHHVGPLAGAALLAGAAGTAIFGVIGLIASIPLLRRIRRRTGSWTVPAALLGLMATAFTISSLLVGPALEGEEAETGDSQSRENDPSDAQDHDEHHQ